LTGILAPPPGGFLTKSKVIQYQVDSVADGEAMNFAARAAIKAARTSLGSTSQGSTAAIESTDPDGAMRKRTGTWPNTPSCRNESAKTLATVLMTTSGFVSRVCAGSSWVAIGFQVANTQTSVIRMGLDPSINDLENL
jgi:hypothetical protein